nr:helix-turn-helix domain-containing protein [uncultured Campylobacter sp.]
MKVCNDIKNESWLTPEQLQNQYGISRTQQAKLRMRRNYKDGATKYPIPFVKIGKHILYLKADIEKWLLSQRKGAICDE